MKWISVKDKLPNHKDTVLVITEKKGYAVVIFVENEEVFKKLISHGIPVQESELNGYAFCSQECIGDVLSGVTHWMILNEDDFRRNL